MKSQHPPVTLQLQQLHENSEKRIQSLLLSAKQQEASDLHIEPFGQHYRVRLRIDGLLHSHQMLTLMVGQRLMSHLKTKARLDTGEKRKPQDGQFRFIHETLKLDVRVSTCPTCLGEKIVLRLLGHTNQQRKLNDLGLSPEQLVIFQNLLRTNAGLILVCGPTGSGKTNTLYAALDYLNTDEKNLVSIEDPVEISLPGINQTPINTKINLDFSDVLRALLRQDPDIIMIGEIRDENTAQIALKAAQTGHLVLATLHCNRANDAFHRLQQLKLSPHELADCLKLVLAQRLVRIHCTHCGGFSCQYCHQGYRGRTGLFELLTITEAVQRHLRQTPTAESFSFHYPRLEAAGNDLLTQKKTSASELHRVL